MIEKEIRLELRQQAVLWSLGSYLFSAVFIIYLSVTIQLGDISPSTWSSFFWIIFLFAAVNTVGKSFISSSKPKDAYLYGLVSPAEILCAKYIYNTTLLCLLGWVCLALFSLLFENPIQNISLFLLILGLASSGFSVILTVVSALASKAQHGQMLMAVLSFPVALGILLLAIRATKNCIDGIEPSASYDEIVNMAGIVLLIATASFLLFPYIWRS